MNNFLEELAVKNSNRANELGIENMNLKKRIDKAIEYIEKYCIDGVENEYNTPQTVFEEDGIEKDNARIELLNILKGEENE